MGVFGAFFGRRGVIGFNGPVLGASRGVVGFNVAMFLRPVCEVFRARRCAGLGCSTALAALLAVGGLHYTKPSRGVSAACRSLMSCNSPRLVAVRYRLTAVWCPKCRPPRSKILKTGCYGRSNLRFGHDSVSRGRLGATREPSGARARAVAPRQIGRAHV